MGLSANDAFAAGGNRRRRRRGRSRGSLSEINVTPLVDVMLVLLIIFMISAPLLTAGVPVELPKTEAGAMQDQPKPLTLSIDYRLQSAADPGSVVVGDVHPNVEEVAGALTPVPGGVGPLTITMLMMNTLRAAEARVAPTKPVAEIRSSWLSLATAARQSEG